MDANTAIGCKPELGMKDISIFVRSSLPDIGCACILYSFNELPNEVTLPLGYLDKG
jgi:hypothetical protein